ncbi:MAG: type II toxin-antitoxin system VapC family toxin [Solirubrobacterales bacterium]
MRLLDTDVLVDYLRGSAGAQAAIRPLAGRERLLASVVTRTELIAGMRSAEKPALEGLFDLLTWIPVSVGIATRGGELSRRYRGSYPGIGLPDYLIAATAAVLGAKLWTQNPRHFPMFEGLEPPYRR